MLCYAAALLLGANSFKMDVFAGVENKNGYQDGIASSSLFFKPKAITCDSKGVLYIADSGNNRIRRIEDGVVKTIAGTGVQGAPFVDGPAKTATFNNVCTILHLSSHSSFVFIVTRDIDGLCYIATWYSIGQQW